ncbi:hypothetical protein [Xenorhabdus sp. KJ12.1]|uniref:hypothetical protein n=1 Tax=Xenorhabdus sp. KJ12.1 TaxID=1851571 RepID=UPI000C045A73|nr:hypothetical protein [Xenorhabdus sp. KJ12.1]PHM72027.1 hypothetical protein Xekj_00817 [Xenorhabdus sp. KJ12.1]
MIIKMTENNKIRHPCIDQNKNGMIDIVAYRARGDTHLTLSVPHHEELDDSYQITGYIENGKGEIITSLQNVSRNKENLSYSLLFSLDDFIINDEYEVYYVIIKPSGERLISEKLNITIKSDSYYLKAPKFPQADPDGVIDIGGMDVSKITYIEMVVPYYSGEEDGDIIQGYLTIEGGDTITSEPYLVETEPADTYIVVFDKHKFSTSGQYQGYYTVSRQSGSKSPPSPEKKVIIKVPPTNPPVDDSDFLIMGARSTLYGAANALPGPQCLTAWDMKRNPIKVTWSYIGIPKTDITWQNNHSSYFYDSAPYLPITATSTSGKTVTLNPLNIFGNGGGHDNVYSDFSEYQTGYIPVSLIYGVPECFTSSFAALLNNRDLVIWGNINPKSLGIVDNNVSKAVAAGCGYLALKEDGALSFWPSATDMDLGGSPPTGNDFIDIGLGGTCAMGLRSDGTYLHWGYYNISPSISHVDSTDKSLFFADDISLYIIDMEMKVIRKLMSQYFPYANYPGYVDSNYSIHSEDLNNPRVLSSFFGNEVMYINNNGTLKMKSYTDYTQAGDSILLSLSVSGLYYNGDFVGGSGQDMDLIYTAIILNSSSQALFLTSPREFYYSLDSNPLIVDNVADISCNRDTAILRHHDGTVTAVNKKNLTKSTINIYKKISQVTCSAKAFAALHVDGTVYAWGDKDYGGVIDEKTQAQLYNVRAIYATGKAFAALTSDNRVVTWGNSLVTEHNDIVEKYINGNISYYAQNE